MFCKLLPSIQMWIEKSKPEVSGNDELEYQDNSKLKKRLPLLVNQDSNSDVLDIFHYI